jgi:hypothetical protein
MERLSPTPFLFLKRSRDVPRQKQTKPTTKRTKRGPKTFLLFSPLVFFCERTLLEFLFCIRLLLAGEDVECLAVRDRRAGSVTHRIDSGVGSWQSSLLGDWGNGRRIVVGHHWFGLLASCLVDRVLGHFGECVVSLATSVRALGFVDVPLKVRLTHQLLHGVSADVLAVQLALTNAWAITEHVALVLCHSWTTSVNVSLGAHDDFSLDEFFRRKG